MTPTEGHSPAIRPGHRAPAELAMERTFSVRLSEWLDVQSRQLFITPAVVMILIFSIFPLVVSLVLAFARIRLQPGGYQVRFVWFDNFAKQFFGSEQFHFLGTCTSISIVGWVIVASRSVGGGPSPMQAAS